MYDFCTIGISGHRQVFHSVDIDGRAFALLLLGLVDGGIRGAVDNVSYLIVKHERFHGLCVGKVKLIAVGIDCGPGHISFQDIAQLIAQLPVGAGNENLHSSDL